MGRYRLEVNLYMEGEDVSLTDDLRAVVNAAVNALEDLASKARNTGSVSDTDVQSTIDTVRAELDKVGEPDGSQEPPTPQPVDPSDPGVPTIPGDGVSGDGTFPAGV